MTSVRTPPNSPEDAVIELMFHFTVLVEYQLLDLQACVRRFVERMTEAVTKLDVLVSEEGRRSQELFERLYNPGHSEAAVLNERADMRVDNIIESTLLAMTRSGNPTDALDNIRGRNASSGSTQDDGAKASAVSALASQMASGAVDEIWSKVAKSFESVCRLEERLRPQVYTIIECLNFEDIQSQRIEHLVQSYKLLNEGLMTRLHEGITGASVDEIQEFSRHLQGRIRSLYTMIEERDIFDQVFLLKSTKYHAADPHQSKAS